MWLKNGTQINWSCSGNVVLIYFSISLFISHAEVTSIPANHVLEVRMPSKPLHQKGLPTNA